MTIVISHQKGGVGKSTIAWNLALFLEKKHSVTIIDLDVQQTLSLTNNIRTTNGLQPLTILTFNSSDKFKSYFSTTPDQTITIIDSGGFDSGMNRMAMMVADLIITPVSDRSFELLGLKKYEQILKELSEIAERKISTHVLLNNINPATKKLSELQEYIQSSQYFNLFSSVLRQRAAYNHANAEGKSVKEFDKKAKSTLEFQRLIKEIKSNFDIL
jgi:chromosome partitioning protein